MPLLWLLPLGLVLIPLAMGASTPAPTFSKDVAPIFFRHCAGCHRPGEIAPMSLLDYRSARPWAKAIRESVAAGRMPPWFADPRHGRFSNDARLSPQEIATIKAWADGGAPEGDRRHLPPAPEFRDGWKLGTPDIVIDIGQDFRVQPGQDAYEHFVVPTNFTEGKWIRAAEIKPGNRRVVHHVHVSMVRDEGEAGSTSIEAMTELTRFMTREGTLTRVRADAPVVNDACAPDTPPLPYLRGAQEGALASFLPGRQPDVFPPGTAKYIAPGTKFEFVVHYARIDDEGQTDRTSVGLYLAPGPPARVLRRMDLRNFFFQIPPGAEHHRVRRCYDFERDQLLLSFTPHMHYRGKDVTYELVHPDGRREILLAVPNYHFDWQLVYRLQEPVLARKGSRLEITTHYDNSANNRANPDPRATVRWGDKSEEEMMSNWIEWLEPEPQPAPSSASAR
jgi:hypothetical protein